MDPAAGCRYQYAMIFIRVFVAKTNRRRLKLVDAPYFELDLPHHMVTADDEFYFFIGHLQGNFILVEVLGEIFIDGYYLISFLYTGCFGGRTLSYVSHNDQSLNEIESTPE